MGALEFTASLVGSLAWPLLVLILVLILRAPIKSLLSSDKPLKLLEAGPTGVKVEYFDNKLEEARVEIEQGRAERPQLPAGAGPGREPSPASDDFLIEMAQLAEVAPRAVVLESFARLEGVLRDALEGHVSDGSSSRRPTSVRALGREAEKIGILAPSELPALDDLAVLRNTVAHGQRIELDAERAMNYAGVARQLMISILLAQGLTVRDEDTSE